MSVAAIGGLPGNLLSYADQSFETGTVGTWASNTNANAPVVDASIFFEGGHSIKWQAPAAGASSIYTFTHVYAAQAGLPYVGSQYVYLPAGSTAFLKLSWQSGSTWLNLDTSGTTITAPTTGWYPVVVNGIAPANTTNLQLVLVCSSTGTGVFYQADLAFMAQSRVQILADWINPAFTPGSVAGSMFADLTPFVESENYQVSMTHGRQDAISEVQNGSCQFTASNSQGWFTLYNTASPWTVGLGARVQVNISYGTASGAAFVYTAFKTRFDGSINEFDYTVDSIAGIPRVQVNCRDIIGNLAQEAALSCWTKQQVLLDKPLRHWSLNDPSGVTQAQETSGNGGSPLSLRQYGAQCTGAFAAGHNGIETQQDAPAWTKTIPGPWSTSTLQSYYSSQSGTSSTQVIGSSAPLIGAIPYLYLNGKISDPTSGFSSSNGWTAEIWATPDPTAATVWSTSNVGQLGILGLNSAYWGTLDIWAHATNTSISASLFVGQPGSFATASSFTGTQTFAWNATNPQPIHIVITCSTGSILTLWVNGSSQTASVPVANQGMAFDQINVGDLGRPSNAASGWSGNLSLVSIYSGILPNGRISTHYTTGLYGIAQTLSGNVVASLASFSGMPSFWYDGSLASHGLTSLDYFDLTGSNPLTAMQAAEAAEAGLLYADTTGVLRFAGRDVRMGAGSGSLTLPPGSFDATLDTKVTDQYVQTSAAVAGSAFGSTLPTLASIAAGSTSGAAFAPNLADGIVAVSMSAAAASKLGQYPNGGPSNPTTLPVQTVAQSLPNLASITPYAQDIADWNVNRNSNVPYKMGSLTVNALVQKDPTGPEWIAPAVLAAQDINSVLTVNMSSNTASFPNVTGVLDLFVEGITEIIGTSIHTIQFYTSPANASRCWVPGDTKLGVLDQTAVIGISQEPTLPSPLVAQHGSDPGGPWLAPAYTTSMNKNQSVSGYVGASDQRGIWFQLQTMLRPPVMVGINSSQASLTPNVWTNIVLNFTLIDNYHGWTTSIPLQSGVTGSGYVVPVAGFYDINAYVQQPSVGTTHSVKIRVDVYDPRFGVTFVAGCGTTAGGGSLGTITPYIRTRCFLGANSVVSLWCDPNAAAAITSGGAQMSIEFIGFSYTAD